MSIEFLVLPLVLLGLAIRGAVAGYLAAPFLPLPRGSVTADLAAILSRIIHEGRKWDRLPACQEEKSTGWKPIPRSGGLSPEPAGGQSPQPLLRRDRLAARCGEDDWFETDFRSAACRWVPPSLVDSASGSSRSEITRGPKSRLAALASALWRQFQRLAAARSLATLTSVAVAEAFKGNGLRTRHIPKGCSEPAQKCSFLRPHLVLRKSRQPVPARRIDAHRERGGICRGGPQRVVMVVDNAPRFLFQQTQRHDRLGMGAGWGGSNAQSLGCLCHADPFGL